MPDTLNSIAVQWLKANGYAGLSNSGAECGCEISDLMPCGEPGDTCEAGYKWLCKDHTACREDCDYEQEEVSWCISSKREEE